MRFEWDSAKNRSNIRHHGIDFADAKVVFDGPTWERWDDREDHGEERWVAIGIMEGVEVTVVYTDRRTRNGVVRQIISARRATRDERETYYRGSSG
jgi:uncharacterized DUF497 family protein